ncbi:SDR family NAD(P)-dependent oxidoreductase, partial [Burkholderia cenocepacia]|nr:SDR family NAD(P)-dependent oxidoreductase [Burkholderia cenocepacia]MDR5670794.1 SDR family NAD(P)-dependent oxidoreductase [Burkholderia cenocepacia]
ERFGRVDALVACAGGHGVGRADETDDAQWRDAMHANLDTAFVSARACLPDLIAQRGNIVLVASIAALAAGPGVCGYTVGKHALLGLARSLARDYGLTVRNSMNIRFLETFVWLAKLENFRLTAEKLHTTQAAVSSRIASLEEAFDVRLFDRNTRSATLTPAGRRMLAYAERIVRLDGEMRRDIDAASDAGLIRIGVIESIVH